jgi:hypothetical protein
VLTLAIVMVWWARNSGEKNHNLMIHIMSFGWQIGQQLVAWFKRLQPALEAQLTTFQQAVEAAVASDSQAGASSPGSTELGKLVSQLGGPEAALLHVQAGLYDYLELLQQHNAIMEQLQAAEQDTDDLHHEGGTAVTQGRGDSNRPSSKSPVAAGGTELLRLCANTLSAVSKGSELHVFLAVRLLELALQAEASAVLGSDIAAVEEAQAVEEALVARYGRVSEDVLSTLARLNMWLSRQYVV